MHKQQQRDYKSQKDFGFCYGSTSLSEATQKLRAIPLTKTGNANEFTR